MAADQETTTAGTPEAVRVLEREAIGRYRAKYPEGVPWQDLDASTRWVWVAYTEIQRGNAGLEGRPVTAQEGRWLHDAVKQSSTLVAPGKLASGVGASEPAGWHAPGIGEVHNADHSLMLFCTKANPDPEADPDYLPDDKLAERVAALLNASGVIAPGGGEG